MRAIHRLDQNCVKSNRFTEDNDDDDDERIDVGQGRTEVFVSKNDDSGSNAFSWRGFYVKKIKLKIFRLPVFMKTLFAVIGKPKIPKVFSLVDVALAADLLATFLFLFLGWVQGFFWFLCRAVLENHFLNSARNTTPKGSSELSSVAGCKKTA